MLGRGLHLTVVCVSSETCKISILSDYPLMDKGWGLVSPCHHSTGTTSAVDSAKFSLLYSFSFLHCVLFQASLSNTGGYRSMDLWLYFIDQ